MKCRKKVNVFEYTFAFFIIVRFAINLLYNFGAVICNKKSKKFNFFSKNYCKIKKSVLEFRRGGKKWYKVG